MTKLKIETWPIGKVLTYAKNARLHSDAQVQGIAASIKEFGFVNPCLVDADGVLIAGHGRILGAKAAGLTTVPVIRLGHLSEEQAKALRIADNALPARATWNQELLLAEIGDLKLAGYDVKLLGFGDATLRSFDPAPDGGTVPEPPKAPTSRPGDLWHLGKHKLICGDATDAETWKRFGTERAAMGFTDPPYGVSYKARSGNFDVIEGDKKRRDELYGMLVKSLRIMTSHIVPSGALYIWHASSTREDFSQAMKAVGITERQYLIWVKPSIVLGHSDYRWQHEPCFYAAKGDKSPAFYGGRAESTVWHVQTASAKDTAITIGTGVLLLDGKGGTMYVQANAPKSKKLRHVRIVEGGSAYLAADESQSTVWQVAKDGGDYEHPTQKPVELARRAIENSSKPGELVIDPFLGSGTTLLGAEMTGRRCYGTELDPKYADVIVRRWEKATGKAATLGAGGPTFAETAAARAKGRGSARNAPAARKTRKRDGETNSASVKGEPEYDGQKDLAGSIAVGFQAVRERVKAGGPGWTPKDAGGAPPASGKGKGGHKDRPTQKTEPATG